MQKVYKDRPISNPQIGTMQSVQSISEMPTGANSPVTPGSPISNGTPGVTEFNATPGLITTNYKSIKTGENENYDSNNTNYTFGDTNRGTGGNSHVKVGVLGNGYGDIDDVLVTNKDEEKEIEYVTPGGPVDGEGDDDDTSQSSEAEMENLRNQIVAQSIAHGVTPGGTNDGTDDGSHKVTKGGKRDSIEMGIALSELIEERDRKRAESKHEQDKKDTKFGKMLSDNLMAIDMIENDIVNDINNDGEGIDNDNDVLNSNGYVTPM